MIKAMTFDLLDTLVHDDSDEPKCGAQGLRSKKEERCYLVWQALNAVEQRLRVILNGLGRSLPAAAMSQLIEDAAQHFIDLLEALHQDPGRKDIAWLLGIDEDVTNEDIRLVEVRNWIEWLVLPAMRR